MHTKLLRTSLMACLIAVGLTGCNSSNDTSTPPTTPETSVKVNVYTSIANCSKADDVANCDFQQGIYVLKIDPSVSDVQQTRAKDQVDDFISGLHDDVKTLFSKKRVVIGLTLSEPDPESPSDADQFVLALANSMNEAEGIPKVLDAIELIYTAIDEDSGPVDETLKLATYQKLIQLFDYYIDANSTPGDELQAAYNQFNALLATQKADAESQSKEYLRHNPCNYGNGQLAAGTCPISEEDEDGTGNKDPIHTLDADLNPGAMMGVTYEYMLDPSKAEIGEMEGSQGTAFTNTKETIASGNADALNWTNPAFKPLADYIEKWLRIKK